MSGSGFQTTRRGTGEFLAAASLGKVPGVRRIVFSGYNSDVDIATAPEDIFPALESTLIPVPASAESWEVVSSSANDTAAGTGARTLSITTLNGSFAEVTQTVTLNGTTPVALTGAHLTTNAAIVLTAGSGGVNAGLLTIRVTGGGAARAYISPGDGVLNQCKYTVPAGFLLELHSAVMGITTTGGAESVRFVFVTTNSAGRQINAVRLPLFAGGQSIYRHEVGCGVPYNTVSATSSTAIRVLSVSQNNTQVDASVIGFLYDLSLWP